MPVLQVSAIPGAYSMPRYRTKGRRLEMKQLNHVLKCRRACFAVSWNTSLTVEASLILPVFVVFVCILLWPVRILDEQLTAQQRLESQTRALALSACTAGELSGGSGMPQEQIITIPYVMNIRFPFGGILPAEPGQARLISRRRAWTGREGGSGREWGTGSSAGDPDENETVYVARNAENSKRYHTSKECHYISNKTVAVPAGEVSRVRNESGGRYHACPVCRPGKDSGTVYVFSDGEAYHEDPSCPALRSYVEEMTRKEAEELGYSECSYCEKNY